jgi:carbamoyltransferase
MYTLGVWDGHDAGACIVENGIIKVAINEERLTRKKLDIKFPDNAILACLKFLQLKPTDIQVVAGCSSQFSRVLARTFPYFDREFYNFRRRLVPKPRFEDLRRALKYRITEIGSNKIFKGITERQLRKKLDKIGFKDYKLYVVDHHMAHAASATFTSGFNKSLCITLDGVGDGLSGTINIFDNGEIERISSISGRDSLGMLYEQVTTLLGMRELEDEGKTMCIADYSYPVPDDKNKMLDFFEVDGLNIKSKHATAKRFFELKNMLFNTRREGFAYMAQKTIEKHMTQLFKNAIEETGLKDVCWSGGVASNIKTNMVIRHQSGLKRWFVFPHMGDGGLAVGAALYIDSSLNGSKGYRMDNAYFGLEYSSEEIMNELKKHKELSFEERGDVAEMTGDLLSNDNYLFWFQGRMEYGPRALGNRSIIASASSEEIKNKLNMQVKRREWFQPFCPSLLVEEAEKIFEDYDGQPDPFMTMGFRAREEMRDRVKSIIHVDRSSRPQMLGNENKHYRKMIEQVKKNTGDGIILNTSFNLHGDPIVCSPSDAIETMIKTKTKYMVVGNFFIELKS